MISLKQIMTDIREDTWIRPLFSAYKKPFILALILGTLTFLFASALMFTSGYLVSASAVVASVLMLHIPLMCVQVFGLGRPILSYFERLTSHDWVFRVTTLLRTKLYHTLEPQGVFYRASMRLGDTLGLLSEDIAHIQDLYLRSIFPMLIAGILYVLLALVLGFMSIPLMLLWLLTIGCAIILLPLISVAICGPKQQLIKMYTHELYEDVTDNVQGVNDWLYSGRSAEYISHVQEKIAMRTCVQSWLVTFNHLRDFILQVCFVVIIIAVIYWAAITLGDSTGARNDTLNWIAAFSLAFFPLIDAFVLIPQAACSGAEKIDTLERLNALTRTTDNETQPIATASNTPNTPDTRGTSDTSSTSNCPATTAAQLHQHPTPSKCTLSCDNVSFHYAQSSTPGLTDISFSLPYGTKCMITGASGAGKTTLSMLLRGDLIPETGSITLGGIPVSSFGDDLAQFICVVSQDPHVFDLTIAENIRLANPEATDEDMWAALEAVQLSSRIQHIPGQLQARVGENAHMFSGGERQRLALARALVSNAPILLLDEVTSALDPKTESEILPFILSAWCDKTIIVISHHVFMAPIFDYILHLDQGRLAYCERFDVLLRTNPHFKEFYTLDSANEM